MKVLDEVDTYAFLVAASNLFYKSDLETTFDTLMNIYNFSVIIDFKIPTPNI